MNKREVVWLIVKLIGTYFVYLTVVSFFSLISSVSLLYSLPSEPSAAAKTDANVAVSPIAAPTGFPSRPTNSSNAAEKTPIDAAAKKLRDEAVKTLLLYIFLTVLYGAIAFYLIRDGKVLFILLNREGKIISDEKEINSLGIYDEN